MSNNTIRILGSIIVTLVIVLLPYQWYTLGEIDFEKHGLTYQEAGTDFTKTFNTQRRKFSIPVIPDNWTPENPLDYKVQRWINPDTSLPVHAEKLVEASYYAEYVGEEDRYNIEKRGDNYYQVVTRFSIQDSSWTCSMRSTPVPEWDGDRVFRYAGTVLTELTLKQAEDTLKKYRLKRLNY